ncbi:hypothetical protein B0H21DRAFT_214254 [Amylocystis lapponica]|nr:hypothetical protein B0H21DRAFT_214254 [Amylocystis lapponica]
MSSTLETHLNTATRAAHSALEARAKELATDEADIADSRIRFEAERLLDLYEELANPAVASDLPRIVKTLMDTDNACSEAFSTALELRLALPTTSTNFVQYSLQQGALQLESSILSIVNSSPSSKTRVMAVLEAMLRIVRAHNVNLTSARSLLLVCKDNARLRLCSESLQVSG